MAQGAPWNAPTPRSPPVSASRPSSTPPGPPGATPIGAARPRKRRRDLWLAVGLIAALLALLLLLSQCGGDDDGGDAAGTSAAASSTAGGTSSTASSGSSSGASSGASSSGSAAPTVAAGSPGSIVTATGQSVLEATAAGDPAGALGTFSGQAVTGTAVQVLTVPADEGFWVGTSDAQRVWVQLTGESGESPYTVAPGDTIDFAGSMVAHDAGFAGQVGVDDAAGAQQLTAQAQHVEAPRSAVTLAG